MEQNRSWEANSHSDSSRNSPPFMEPKGIFLCSREPAAGPCPELDAYGPCFPPYFPKSHCNITLPFTLWVICSLHVFWPPILYAFLVYPVCATCPAHLILLNSITLTVFGVKCASSSLYSLIQLPATYSLLGPNIVLNTLFSNSLTLCSSLSVRDQFSCPYKATGKITVLYFNL
jgi:hypothetical protein